MGLGKTIQTLALIAKQNELLKEKGPTLIVAPVSLMFQWKQEIFDKTLLKVIIYHGNNREKGNSLVLVIIESSLEML